MAEKETAAEQAGGFIFAVVFGLLAFGALLDFLSAHRGAVVFTLCAAGGALVVWYLYKKYDRHERGMGESQRLYRAAQELLQTIKPLPPDRATHFFTEQIAQYLPSAPSPPLVAAALRIYSQEDFSVPAPPLGGPVEHAAYRDELRDKMRAFQNPQQTYDLFVETIVNALACFRAPLPHLDDCSFTVPAIDLIPDVPEAVRDLLANFYQPSVRDRGLFLEMRKVLDANALRLTETHLPASARNAGKFLMPKDHPGPTHEIVDDYLAGTPLRDLFYEPMPFGLPAGTRFEHTHVVAGSGHGKTQTLQHLIVSDLARPDPPSLVIIDSQGDMLRKLSHLAFFDPQGGALASKLVIIDPTDIEHPPALNMFDINQERFRTYGAAAREQILNGVIELYDYMFGSLLGAELTQKQSVIFRYLARLMITIPGATIHDFLRLMENATPYIKHIEALPLGSRTFFEIDFVHRSFDQTKQQIRRRLLGILENPTFERMFTAPKNRIDMFEALNTGKIVLVNTAKDFLKSERSSLLGRFFVALTLQAVLERAALPAERRRPAFLYIDEAADYFDDNIDDLLTQARKYNLGVIFAHQYLDQLAPGLRASIAANTSTKLAGGVSTVDARSLAPDMHTTPDFIRAQHKEAHGTRFACSIRNVTANAITLSVPFGTLENQPMMADAAYNSLIALNRSRTSGTGEKPADREQSADPSVRLHSPDLAWKLEPQPNGRIRRVDDNGDVHFDLDLAWRDLGSPQPVNLGDRTIRVQVPGDAHNGEVLRAQGHGKVTTPGQPAGDLYVTVRLPDLAIGDLIQWESDGALGFDKPRRVRGVEDYQGQTWVFVEESETGIPLTQVVLVQRAPAQTPAPEFPPPRDSGRKKPKKKPGGHSPPPPEGIRPEAHRDDWIS